MRALTTRLPASVTALGIILGSLGSVSAERSTIPWPALNGSLPLWQPANRAPDAKSPAIVFYHGTHGRPTIRTMLSATEGQDYVLLGMGYLQSGRFQYHEKAISEEMAQFAAVRKHLVNHCQVDPTQIYVAGFSKGGWFAATLLERDESLAGGLVLGAGVFHGRHEKPRKPYGTKPAIYLGAGRDDQNYPQAVRAATHFRGRGASVTLEAWPGIGHRYPDATPSVLEQWLAIRSGRESVPAEADQWISQRTKAILKIKVPLKAWHACNEFLRSPYVQHFGQDAARTSVQAHRKRLEAGSPKIAAEAQSAKQLQANLLRESQNRYVTTLKQVHQRYQEIAQEGEGTHAGKQAAFDAVRTEEMLRQATGRATNR